MSTQTLAERIARRDPLLVEGGMGTMLFERGLAPGACPETFNLQRPEVLREIAQAYADAGADVVETNTFGASPLALARYGLHDKVEAINAAAVGAARAAAGDRAFVAACIGPCGAMLKPYGDAEPDNVLAGYRRQVEALVGAGIDGVFVETMIDLSEARLAVRAAKAVAPDLPVLASMTFDATPRGFFTVMGVAIEQAASGLRAAGADAVGSNCGNGIEKMVEIARAFAECTDLPLVIQSNAGLPDTSSGAAVYPETPEFMAARVPDLLAAGVSIVGGCCGTTPQHISAFREAIDAFES
jgi:5-methyltetrahydrofolate--homocysteine methyltransferase